MARKNIWSLHKIPNQIQITTYQRRSRSSGAEEKPTTRPATPPDWALKAKNDRTLMSK